MFIYSGIVLIWTPWILICHPPVSFVKWHYQAASQNPEDSNGNNDLKMNIIVIMNPTTDVRA